MPFFYKFTSLLFFLKVLIKHILRSYIDIFDQILSLTREWAIFGFINPIGSTYKIYIVNTKYHIHEKVSNLLICKHKIKR